MSDFTKLSFEKELPDYGDLIPIDEWRESVEYGMFTEDDGCGNWVKDGKMTRNWSDHVCDLDVIDEAIEFGITHVMWFNK